jgi:hypothetical protein
LNVVFLRQSSNHVGTAARKEASKACLYSSIATGQGYRLTGLQLPQSQSTHGSTKVGSASD